jgi:hypothetical protein
MEPGAGKSTENYWTPAKMGKGDSQSAALGDVRLASQDEWLIALAVAEYMA